MSKNILITGAAGNLGTAVVKKMQVDGHQVWGIVEPGHSSGEGAFFECDLTSEPATVDLFRRLKARNQSLDAAVLLVGGFAMGSIERATSEDMMHMFMLNYMTAFHTARQAYSWMKKNGGGKIIFTGAKPAVDGGGAAALPYAVSKTAVIKLAEIINESGEKDNIQASVIVPSIIDTLPNRKGMPDARFEDWVKPTEIAEAIAFLISDAGNPLRDTVLKLYNNA